MHDDDLSPDERAAFEALPRERDPGRMLEERTVQALRARGLLAPPHPLQGLPDDPDVAAARTLVHGTLTAGPTADPNAKVVVPEP